MAYYVMTCEGPYPIKPIAITPDIEISWTSGEPVAFEDGSTLVYVLDDDHDGDPLAMYQGACPVMRHDLVEALTSAGVDNIQYLPAVLEDRQRGIRHAKYKACNIVGGVACADMEKSDLVETAEAGLGDMNFRNLVLDESKMRGLLLFRLAEKLDVVVVSERVRQTIERRQVAGMVFYGPGEWPG